jgi:hypothetical protein
LQLESQPGILVIAHADSPAPRPDQQTGRDAVGAVSSHIYGAVIRRCDENTLAMNPGISDEACDDL